MKNYILGFLLRIALAIILVSAVNKSHAAAEFDLVKGVDLTATNLVSAALLNQLVDAGYIAATNKGGVIRRSGESGAYWPDVTSNPRYTNFLWLDNQIYPGTLKQYVPSGDVFSNWVPATLGVGSVTGSEIKDYTILAIDIGTNAIMAYAISNSAVTADKIQAGAVTGGKLAPLAVQEGNIAVGAIATADITNNAITSIKIADGTITRDDLISQIIGSGQLSNLVVQTAHIALTNITRDLIRDDAIGPDQITNGAVTSELITDGTIDTNDLTAGVLKNFIKVAGYVFKGTNTGLTAFTNSLNIHQVIRTNTGDYVIFFTNVTFTTTNFVATAIAHNQDQNTLSVQDKTLTWLRFKVENPSTGVDHNEDFSFVIWSFIE